MVNTTQHILIVDDVLKNLQLTAQILKNEGYIISLAQDGNTVLNMLNDEIPDLILLDIMMPGMDGIEVCRVIKNNKKWKEIPIIFLTALNETENIIKGFQAGGIDYVTKPFNRDELVIRIKTHLDLSTTKKNLLETIRTRDKLYSIIAHDIRSPLASITMVIGAMANGNLKPGIDKFKDILLDLNKSVNEVNNLINNLLDWTRLQIGTIKLKLQNISLFSLIDDCIQLLDKNARDKNITMGINIPENTYAFIDEITMHTVFRNLISNAIKFTPDNGIIYIEAQSSEDSVTVMVKDTGIGISAEVLQKIFRNNEPHTTPGTKNEPGTGLGIPLVKEMVEQNKGTLKVESIVGKGTTFYITIPASGEIQ